MVNHRMRRPQWAAIPAALLALGILESCGKDVALEDQIPQDTSPEGSIELPDLEPDEFPASEEGADAKSGRGQGASPEGSPQNGAPADSAHLSNAAFSVEPGTALMRAGSSRSFATQCRSCDASPVIEWTIVAPSGFTGRDLGSVSSDGRYTAPQNWPTGLQELEVKATVAGRPELTGGVRIRTLGADEILLADDGVTDAPAGNLYDLRAYKSQFPSTGAVVLPDFSQLTPIAKVMIPNFAIATRSFTSGFPGVSSQFEWFGLTFSGSIQVETAGLHTFTLASDDGAKFTLDGRLLINNDGVHATREISATVMLNAGRVPFQLAYFQGPKEHIALQLFWKKPGDEKRTLVPPHALHRSP